MYLFSYHSPTYTHFTIWAWFIFYSPRQAPQAAVLLPATGERSRPNAGLHIHLSGCGGSAAGLHAWNCQRGSRRDGLHPHRWHSHPHGPPGVHDGRHEERGTSNDRQQRTAASSRWESRNAVINDMSVFNEMLTHLRLNQTPGDTSQNTFTISLFIVPLLRVRNYIKIVLFLFKKTLSWLVIIHMNVLWYTVVPHF